MHWNSNWQRKWNRGKIKPAGNHKTYKKSTLHASLGWTACAYMLKIRYVVNIQRVFIYLKVMELLIVTAMCAEVIRASFSWSFYSPFIMWCTVFGFVKRSLHNKKKKNVCTVWKQRKKYHKHYTNRQLPFPKHKRRRLIIWMLPDHNTYHIS